MQFESKKLRTAALVTLGTLLATGARADGFELVKYEDVAKSGLIEANIAVPESPAFTALGLNPEDVTRPGTPRQFATAILTGIDKKGNFQTGLALDTVPYLLIDGNNLSLNEYRKHDLNWKRLLARTQLSIATTKGTSGDDESVRLSAGLRMTPWSRGDARMDEALITCLGVAALPKLEHLDRAGAAADAEPIIIEEMGDAPFEDQPTDPVEIARAEAAVDARIAAYFGDVAAWEAKAMQQSEACLVSAEARLNKASGWDLGAAPTWIQEGGSSSDIDWGGATFWSSFAWNLADGLAPEKQALSRRPQWITHARFRLDEVVANANDPSGFVEQNSLLVGTRLRFGSPRLSFSLEASYMREDPDGLSADNTYRGALHTDVKVYEQLWVQLALGASGGDAGSQVQLGATFKWGERGTDLTEILDAVKRGAAAL